MPSQIDRSTRGRLRRPKSTTAGQNKALSGAAAAGSTKRAPPCLGKVCGWPWGRVAEALLPAASDRRIDPICPPPPSRVAAASSLCRRSTRPPVAPVAGLGLGCLLCFGRVCGSRTWSVRAPEGLACRGGQLFGRAIRQARGERRVPGEGYGYARTKDARKSASSTCVARSTDLGINWIARACGARLIN